MKTSELKVRLTFFEEVLGTASNNPEIHDEFIASKAPDSPTKNEQRKEEIEALGVGEVVEKSMTIFPRMVVDGNSVPFVYDYQVKGFFKDSCKSLRGVKETLSSKLTAYQKEIDGKVFIKERKIPFQNFGRVGECQRPRSVAQQRQRQIYLGGDCRMSKPKFKVGDRVRILDGSNIKNYYGGWSTHMKGCVGKIATVRRLCSHYTQNSYLLEGSIYSWDERGLEPVNPEKIIIYRNGSEVIAKNTATGKTGVARCNPADEFDFNTGAKLAFECLINPEPEKPKYYSGKVVCINSRTTSFTKGKVYEVNDGVLDTNYGIYACRHFTTFTEIQNALTSDFIELVE